jgi:cell division protein FtsN
MLDEGARNKATALISGESTEQTVTANSTETTTPPAEENKEAENATDQNTTGDTENSSEGNDNTADAQNQEETPKVVADNTTTNTTPTGSGSALVSSKTGRFYLSIASYPNESDAMARRQKLIAQGYTDAKVVEAGANKYRVSLADFANRAEANNKVAASKADYDSIWVFKF